MTSFYTFCFALLGLSLVLIAYRLFRGPTPADRVLALDLLAVCSAAAILIYAVAGKAPVFIDVVVVLGAIIFFGTVALARTISRTHKTDD